ncbi:glycoside hydrolase N-terminal domain-containing protein [Streptomyces sp. NPDC005899]|uniref:glycosyl hydrolase family 95 catalytic domain-containing protein n=1 Tax=Streptomyces sp. NPDC005899 TaxID=3155716 RepID=UPI0033F5AB2A
MIDGTWEPVPATRWEDAFLSGNGHHGAMVYGDPADDRVIVDHHTLVRPNGSEDLRPPELADRLGRLQDALLAGDVTAAEGFGAGLPLVWVQPFHPAFQTRVRRGRGLHEAVAGYRREVDFTTGEVTASYESWRSRVFVSRADDVIVQHVTDLPLSARLVLDHALPGAPARLAVGRTTVLTPDGANLALRIGYPDSDVAYTGVTAARVDGGTVSVADEGIRIEGARALTLTTRVLRRAGGHPDLTALWAALPGEDYETLLARHRPPHRTAYGRTSLTLRGAAPERELPGSELLRAPQSPALLERLFAAGRYHLLSSSGLLPPRLTGLWTGDWETAWSGAFTTNANLNLQIASAASAALPEVTEAHASLVHGQLGDWQDNARALFGARGIVAPSHTDGESGHTRHFQRAYPLHLWTAGADWLLQPLLEHAEVTTGAPDARLTAALVEAALFYEDFLTREDPDGRVAVVPSYSPENRPANASWGTVNATMDIAAARHALTTAATHAPGHPSAGVWRALAARLPEYVVNEDGALAEWAWPGLAETYDHRHLSHLYPVWPLDEINPYDTPGAARAAHRALELRGSENDSAHGHLHHALVAARLRDPARVSAALDAVLGGDFFHDSLMSAHYPSRDVYNADAAHTLPAAVIEALVQSAPGRLVLLPALPAAYPAGELRGVRTRFGARLDLSWSDDGASALLRPTRDVTVDVRTGDGHALTETSAGDSPAPLELTAGVDRVLTLRPR